MSVCGTYTAVFLYNRPVLLSGLETVITSIAINELPGLGKNSIKGYSHCHWLWIITYSTLLNALVLKTRQLSAQNLTYGLRIAVY